MQDFTTLTQALKISSLNDILEQVMSQVKTHPQDLNEREILFKLYCIEGSWEKALLQLQTLSLMGDKRSKQTELYKNLVFSEIQRQQVLTGDRQASTLQGDMPTWMNKLHKANVEHYEGLIDQAALSRYEAFDLALETAGKSDELGAFSWIADSDCRLGPVFEFICAGGYRWLPYSSIKKLNVPKPENILDLLWLPATIEVGEETYYGYTPVRYPLFGTVTQEVKLGLTTEWQQLSDAFSIGLGRKVLVTDQTEQSIMEVGDIVFE
ncbi:type VI secretion system accessory protein TagJ [Hafnia alvei]|uniref:ImpE family T6SS protein Cts1E n=1 Tax=Hafnia alvei TaxID=569 RepID=A0ABD7QBI0_HAFAL|nr:type VI secretion system accessory protein TagJ [Hafnia alvei]TBL70811.1 ImpE family T6SS protein Cts1E [Hafnia alvei]